jgi:hypothetical protein
MIASEAHAAHQHRPGVTRVRAPAAGERLRLRRRHAERHHARRRGSGADGGGAARRGARAPCGPDRPAEDDGGADAEVALDVKVILTPPCIFHK